MLKSKQKKSRQEINDASWELKRKRKHKGLPSGSRFNNDQQNKTELTTKQTIDRRIGSKKPISLIEVKNDVKIAASIANPTETWAFKKAGNEFVAQRNKSKTLSPEQELEQLENDPLLDQLLDLVEQNQKLTKEQQSYLDNKLDRIDQLMKQLGYLEEENEPENEKKEDIVGLLKRK